MAAPISSRLSVQRSYSRTSPPKPITPSTLTFGESDGMTMIAGVPTRAAAAATPWAWLPDEKATTPRLFSSAFSRLMRL